MAYIIINNVLLDLVPTYMRALLQIPSLDLAPKQRLRCLARSKWKITAHKFLPAGPMSSPPLDGAPAPAAVPEQQRQARAPEQHEAPHPPEPRAPPRPVVLILVGIPGSGKSTFAQALSQRSRSEGAPPGAARWVAVNQDTASKSGKPGTREQCVRAAAAAIAAGSCVVVDR